MHKGGRKTATLGRHYVILNSRRSFLARVSDANRKCDGGKSNDGRSKTESVMSEITRVCFYIRVRFAAVFQLGFEKYRVQLADGGHIYA